MRQIIESVLSEYRRYKKIGEGAMPQLTPDELCAPPAAGTLAISSLVWHLSGNLTSRFTDFLTSDGEKPWRQRDAEFEPRHASPRGEGWQSLNIRPGQSTQYNQNPTLERAPKEPS